ANQPISEADEEWLVNAGNLMDEERVVGQLDKAADFKSGLERLDELNQSIVQKLMDLAANDGNHRFLIGSKMKQNVCQTQHPEVTEMLDLWILKAMADEILLTGKVLRQKWTEFANLAAISEDKRLCLSAGWLT
ncbi:hypothetical protein OG21DRAFT_1528359, partial [Imleria badia]